MDNQSAASQWRNVAVRSWPWLVVLLVLLFVGFIRFRLLDMPLERDEGEYAYAGQLILQGIPPYELAYNMKLPGTYFAYAIGMALFGQTSAGVHLTLLVTNGLTVIFVFLLGRHLRGVTVGLVACASYAVMSASPMLMGLAGHAEHFVVLFAVPATLLLLKADESSRRSTYLFSGLLYGLAFLMKQQGICFGLFGGTFLLWRALRNNSLFSAGFLKNAAAFAFGAVSPFALLCLGMALAGFFSRFWFWTFTYAHSYVGMQTTSEGLVHLRRHLTETRDLSLAFWILILLGLPSAWHNKSLRRAVMFAMCFWIFSFGATALGLYFRPHYFIHLLPAFAILVGLAVDSLQDVVKFKWFQNVFKCLPLIFFTLALSWEVFYQAQFFFQFTPRQVCRSLYQGNPLEESLAVADYIRDHSPVTARIAVLGSEPQIYFYARRHSATGYMYMYALMEPHPAVSLMQNEVMRQVESSKPEYLVYVSYVMSWGIFYYPHPDRSIFHWVDQYSRQCYAQVGFVHRDGNGNVECFWDDAAKNHPPAQEEFIAVYKRLP